jgi:hypothetical protein
VRVGEDADIRYAYQGSDWRAWHRWLSASNRPAY